MLEKEHGTCEKPVMKDLRWKCESKMSDHICCYNRHYAEHLGYWQETDFVSYVRGLPETSSVTFYDSVSGLPLFVAPKGRNMDEFIKESMAHGWPSFRDEEVVSENVFELPGGEVVSVSGTHLGHNIPDGPSRERNRYCINLVSVAGRPSEAACNDV